jgi:hypothetical protein
MKRHSDWSPMSVGSKRSIVRQSLSEVANDVGIDMRAASLPFPPGTSRIARATSVAIALPRTSAASAAVLASWLYRQRTCNVRHFKV